jgi:hypothetical protein
MGAIFGGSIANREKERLAQSHANPIVAIHSRDSFRYYENGHWVTVSGELMSGSTGVDRVIYRDSQMLWNDAGKQLSQEERKKVLQKIGEHLDKRKVRWEFR